MLLHNIGGKGGLKLVIEAFIDWGMKAMGFVARELTVEDITTKGVTSFMKAKKQ